MSNQPRLAVLIDADNIQVNLAEQLLALCKTFGKPIIKRAYGDFTQGKASHWKLVLAKHNIAPQQNFPVSSKKNAADISLVVDAMDILHKGQVDAFCLLSSDSDFTRLATRIRECDRSVYGFGDESTPRAMQAACDEFKLICFPKQVESTKPAITIAPTQKALQNPAHRKAQKLNSASKKPYLKAYNFVRKELQKLTTDNNWVSLSQLDSKISETFPKIDYNEFGGNELAKVVKLVKETGLIETKGLSTKDAKLRFASAA